MTYSPIWSFGAIIKLFTTYPAYLGHPLCIGHWKSILGIGNIKHWRDRMKTCSFVLSHLFPQQTSLSPSLTTSLPIPCAYTIEAPQLHHKAPTDTSHIEEFERKPRLVPSLASESEYEDTKPSCRVQCVVVECEGLLVGLEDCCTTTASIQESWPPVLRLWV